MCDYNSLSRKTVSDLNRPGRDIAAFSSSPAWRRLSDLDSTGRLKRGHDFTDGTKLDAGGLQRGHYLQPANFQRALNTMAKQPHLCAWCGRRLPGGLVRQHRVEHDHREHIAHHFHPDCWIVRLVAIAVVFGHLVAADIRVNTKPTRAPARDVTPVGGSKRLPHRKARG